MLRRKSGIIRHALQESEKDYQTQIESDGCLASSLLADIIVSPSAASKTRTSKWS